MIDEYLRVVANQNRRRLLQNLINQDEDEELSVPEAVVQGEADPKTVRLEFYHRHLPKLERLGLIDWDRDTDTVTNGPNFGEIRPLIEAVDTVEQSMKDST